MIKIYLLCKQMANPYFEDYLYEIEFHPPPIPPRRHPLHRSATAPTVMRESDPYEGAKPVDLDKIDKTLRACITEFGSDPYTYTKAANHKINTAYPKYSREEIKRLRQLARRCDRVTFEPGKIGGRRRTRRLHRRRLRATKNRRKRRRRTRRVKYRRKRRRTKRRRRNSRK